MFGTKSFPTGTVVNVVLVTDVNATNATLYVNPTNTTFGIDPIYASSEGGTNGQTFTADVGYGSFGWSQYGTAATPENGARFFKVGATTNWSAAVSFLTGGFLADRSVHELGDALLSRWWSEFGPWRRSTG